MSDTTTTALVTTRATTHGEFSCRARITQDLKLVMASTDNWLILSPPQKEALDQIANKIGRILAGDPDFRDHWDDIAGYAHLARNNK